MRIGFRPLTADELPLLYEWLQREHVKRWWTDRETYDEVVQHYLPEIEGSRPTDPISSSLRVCPSGSSKRTECPITRSTAISSPLRRVWRGSTSLSPSRN